MLSSHSLLKALSSTALIMKSVGFFPNFSHFPQAQHKYHFCSVPKDNNKEELLLYLNSKLQTPPNLQTFNENIEVLRSLHTKEYLNQNEIRELYQKCITYFNTIPKEASNFQEEQLNITSELLAGLYQSMIEALDTNIIVLSSKSMSQFDPKYTKPYWHFIEFLLTRTKFISLFEGTHVVRLLESYYQIQERYESDKFAYIFDKFDEYICGKESLNLSHEDMAKILYFYAKCDIGSDMFFQKMFERFIAEKESLEIKDLVICAWSFVSYNLKKKNKTMLIYTQGVHERVLSRVKDLNSYQAKQFLWAYHKEKELFGLN